MKMNLLITLDKQNQDKNPKFWAAEGEKKAMLSFRAAEQYPYRDSTFVDVLCFGDEAEATFADFCNALNRTKDNAVTLKCTVECYQPRAEIYKRKSGEHAGEDAVALKYTAYNVMIGHAITKKKSAAVTPASVVVGAATSEATSAPGMQSMASAPAPILAAQIAEPNADDFVPTDDGELIW